MKEIKSTLDGLFFYSKRRSGNSTKQIDLAIKLLYDGYKVKVEDHFGNGSHENANKNLFRRILKRLSLEHNLDMLISGNKIEIDDLNLTLELLIDEEKERGGK